jgi:hypothetical protein
MGDIFRLFSTSLNRGSGHEHVYSQDLSPSYKTLRNKLARLILESIFNLV